MRQTLILIYALAAALLTPPAATAQTVSKPATIGLLDMGRKTPDRIGLLRVFTDRLSELGYTEGHHVNFVRRWSGGKGPRLDAMAKELVALRVNAIVTIGTPAVRAAKRATSTVPIVMSVVSNPVENGLIGSLARPGGNITGMALLTTELAVKRLELMRDTLPKAPRFALLGDEGHPNFKPSVRATRVAARIMGVSLQIYGVRNAREIEGAISRMADAHVEAVIIIPGNAIGSASSSLAELAGLTTRASLPATHPHPKFVVHGGLLSYGTDLSYPIIRSADYIDKILRGAKPSELPVEQIQPSSLVVNLKTAKTLGLTIPLAVLLRATEVIE